jgi:hypothetical protein
MAPAANSTPGRVQHPDSRRYVSGLGRFGALARFGALGHSGTRASGQGH